VSISICVCTYNRAHILCYCLESLINLTVPAGCKVEILIIDNNSADNTKHVVDFFSQRSPIKILYLNESQQGLSAARNLAINQATGDYIGFLDDECVVRPNWLEIVVADIHEFAPLIIGGPYIGVVLPGTAPKWFKAEYGNAYFLASRYDRGYQKEFRAPGGNMFLHRSVFEVCQFSNNFGMKGNEVKLGEEDLLQDRFLSERAGTMVFYEPGIEVVHYVLPHKMSLSYAARRAMETGAATYRIRPFPLACNIAGALVHLSLYPWRGLLRDRTAYPHWQNYVYEKAIPRVMPVLGAIIEKIRRRYR
jgi:glycosyltransferase involved in cell wall biosynthesis